MTETEVALMSGGSVANSMAIIPDGRLCGAGRDKYIGLDQARADWPVTILPAGGSPFTFRWSVTANHNVAKFHFFVTKDGYNPTVPLKWSDLEKFAEFQNPTLDAVAGLDYPVYQFPATLPNKTGRHLIYMIWERQDSIEDFYSCSDVWFGSSPTPTPTQAPACTAPAWVAGTYATGDIVSYNNKEWVARWGNSDAPSSSTIAAPWKLNGICTSGGGGGPTNTPCADYCYEDQYPGCGDYIHPHQYSAGCEYCHPYCHCWWPNRHPHPHTNRRGDYCHCHPHRHSGC